MGRKCQTLTQSVVAVDILILSDWLCHLQLPRCTLTLQGSVTGAWGRRSAEGPALQDLAAQLVRKDLHSHVENSQYLSVKTCDWPRRGTEPRLGGSGEQGKFFALCTCPWEQLGDREPASGPSLSYKHFRALLPWGKGLGRAGALQRRCGPGGVMVPAHLNKGLKEQMCAQTNSRREADEPESKCRCSRGNHRALKNGRVWEDGRQARLQAGDPHRRREKGVGEGWKEGGRAVGERT